MSERQQMALLMQMTSGEWCELSSSGNIFNIFSIISLPDTTTSTSGGRSPGPGAGFPASATSSVSGGGGGSSSASNVLSSATATGPARYRDKNGRGESSLHVAAIKGDYEQVKKLLDQGIPPNVTDNAGE